MTLREQIAHLGIKREIILKLAEEAPLEAIFYWEGLYQWRWIQREGLTDTPSLREDFLVLHYSYFCDFRQGKLYDGIWEFEDGELTG